MTAAPEYTSADSHQDVLVLTIKPQRVQQYDVAEAMGREMMREVTSRQATKVVVDMRNLQFMSSVGYGPLISLRSRVREAGGRLILCNINGVVRETLESTRLLINPHSPRSLFEHASDLPAALDALA
jgi:anti-anti-sigma factor